MGGCFPKYWKEGRVLVLLKAHDKNRTLTKILGRLKELGCKELEKWKIDFRDRRARIREERKQDGGMLPGADRRVQ